jgi:plastocyanin
LQHRTRRLVLALFATGALVVAACGDDDDTADTTDDTEATTGATTTAGGPEETTDDATETEAEATDDATETEAEATDDGEEASGETIEVTATEYEFDGIPDTVEAGTTFNFTNEGEEAHELVILPMPEGEERSAEELAQLPMDELIPLFTEPPATVLLADPGEEGQAVEGDGSVSEPGDYLAVCTFPVGTASLDELEGGEEGPPEGDGPRHLTEGMYAEFTVE